MADEKKPGPAGEAEKPKKVYVEGKDYPKIRIGDKVKVVIKDRRNMTSDRAFNYMLSRPWFTVKEINMEKGFPNLDIGCTNPGVGTPVFYPIFRFDLVGPEDINPDDPYGEEKWDVVTTFDNHVRLPEKKACQIIERNIAKLWIDKNDLSSIVKVVGIIENFDNYKYTIRYSKFKVKEKDTVASAEDFLKNWAILSPDFIEELEKRIVEAENEYKRKVDHYNKLYEEELRAAEESLKRNMNKIETNLKEEKIKFNGAIEMCKKQK